MMTSVPPKMGAQPKVRGADASALRACDGQFGVRSLLFAVAAFLVHLLQSFLLKGLHPLVCCKPQGTTVGGECLPAIQRDTAGLKGSLEAVLVAVEWSPSVSFASS